MNEFYAKIAAVVARQVTKAALVAQGMPEVAADMSAEVVIDGLASIITRAMVRNDAGAQAAMDEINESMLLELQAKRHAYEGGRAPSREDVEHALVRFAAKTRTAGSHKKRWVLFNALHNSFRPEFYNEGLAQILWPIVEVLEYPDLRFLNDVLTCLELPESPELHPIGLRVVDGKYVRLRNIDIRYKFARRLEEQGLLLTEDLSHALGTLKPIGGEGGAVRGNGLIGLAPTGIAKKVREFALEEFWKEETSATTD